MLGLDNFFVSYPPQFTRERRLLQQIIAEKREFAELGSRPSEPRPGPYQFYNHQLFAQRFLEQWPAMIIIDEAGTGKTRKVLAASENFKRMHALMGEAAPIRKTLILVSGPNVENEWRNQIACCSPDYAGTSLKKLNALIDEWYEITTYRKFGNDVYADKRTLPTPENIQERYNRYYIVVDEVQNLRNEGNVMGTGKDENSKLLQALSDLEGKRSGRNAAQAIDRSYGALMHVVTHAKNTVRSIASATIMYRRVTDLPRLANIVLPPEYRWSDDELARKPTEEEIIQKLGGCISFVAQSGAARKVSAVQVGN